MASPFFRARGGASRFVPSLLLESTGDADRRLEKRVQEAGMKSLLSGNEAIALGAWEAGVRYAAARPGIPSTESLPALAHHSGGR